MPAFFSKDMKDVKTSFDRANTQIYLFYASGELLFSFLRMKVSKRLKGGAEGLNIQNLKNLV